MSYDNENKAPVKAYTKYELANLYGISVEVLVKWLKLADLYDETVKWAKILPPITVQKLFDHIGYPEA